MAIRLCKVCGDWHDLDKPWPHNCQSEPNWAQSDLPGPYIAGDTMQPVQSMRDGKMYDSKSRLRRTYRQAGMIEVGNDPALFRKKPKPPPDRQKIRATIHRAFSKAGLGA